MLAAELTRRGIRTPQVAAARARTSPVYGWQLELMTRRVPATVDLGFVLGAARRGEVSRPAWHAVLRAFGALVAELHEAGFLHADLQPNNVLVQRAALEMRNGEPLEAPTLWVLDLDRSRFELRLDAQQCRNNLRRLYRHVDRRDAEHGAALGRADVRRFLEGYDPSGTRWKADWRAIAAEHTRRGGVHRVGWWLERLFTDAPDPRSQPGAAPRGR